MDETERALVVDAFKRKVGAGVFGAVVSLGLIVAGVSFNDASGESMGNKAILVGVLALVGSVTMIVRAAKDKERGLALLESDGPGGAS